MTCELLEVRCCCRPEKLLGWLPVPGLAFPGQSITFLVMPRPVFGRPTALAAFAAERLELPVALYRADDGTRRALKSEDTPIETLRLIPGFVENR